MPSMDDYLQLQQDSADYRVHAERGCTTDPQSIAWEGKKNKDQ